MKHLALSSFLTLLALMAVACSSTSPQTFSTVSSSLADTPPSLLLPSDATGLTPPASVQPTQTAVVPDTPTASAIPTLEPTETINREFDAFVQSVKNGNPNEIVGVYVEGILALRVVQQPAGQAAWVSTVEGEATEFLLAFTIAGNIGLLAHNYLSGRYFFNLQSGDIVQLIYGDGSVWEYEINDIRSYQALSPQSPSSDFVDLTSGEVFTATNLFYRVYGGEYHLTFQTCIDRDGNFEWGRLFPMAYPYQW